MHACRVVILLLRISCSFYGLDNACMVRYIDKQLRLFGGKNQFDSIVLLHGLLLPLCACGRSWFSFLCDCSSGGVGSYTADN